MLILLSENICNTEYSLSGIAKPLVNCAIFTKSITNLVAAKL